MTDYDLLKVIKAVVEQADADGCNMCAFYDREEWEAPCNKCRRSCKDYWRRAENDE